MAESNAELNPRSGLEACVVDYLAHLKTEGARSDTVAAYTTDLRQFALFLYPRVDDLRLPLSAVSSDLIRAYRDELINRGLTASSVARKLAVLRSLFRYLCQQGIAPGNPAAAVSGPDLDRSQPDVIAVEAVEATFDQIDPGQFSSARNRAILEIFYSSGLMLGELVRLNLSSLDLEAGMIAISGGGGRSRDRAVPIGERARSALKQYLQLRARQLLSLDIGEIDAGALFVNERGRRLHPRTVQRIVDRVVGWAIEGKTVGPGVLRRTCAAHMIEAGADVAAVRELLGRANLQSAASTTKIDLERLRRIYQQAHPRS